MCALVCVSALQIIAQHLILFWLRLAMNHIKFYKKSLFLNEAANFINSLMTFLRVVDFGEKFCCCYKLEDIARCSFGIWKIGTVFDFNLIFARKPKRGLCIRPIIDNIQREKFIKVFFESLTRISTSFF